MRRKGVPVPTRSPARAHSTTPRRLSPPCACTGWGTTHPPAHRPPASASHWLSHEMPHSTLEPPLLPLSGEKRPSKVSFTDGTQGQQRARGLGLEQDCGTRSACSVPSGGPGLRVGRGSTPTPSPDWLGHRGPSAPRREAAEVPLQGGPRAGRRGKENDPVTTGRLPRRETPGSGPPRAGF